MLVDGREVGDQGQPADAQSSGQGQVQNPLGPIGDRRKALGRQARRLRQAQGDHREIDALEAQQGHPDQHAEQHGHEDGSHERRPEGAAQPGDEDRRGVAPHQGEGPLPDVDAADIEDQPHPRTDHAQDGRGGEDPQKIGPVPKHKGNGHEINQQEYR